MSLIRRVPSAPVSDSPCTVYKCTLGQRPGGSEESGRADRGSGPARNLVRRRGWDREVRDVLGHQDVQRRSWRVRVPEPGLLASPTSVSETPIYIDEGSGLEDGVTTRPARCTDLESRG